MKFGLFTDTHYSQYEGSPTGTRRPKKSYEKVKTAFETFKKAQVDFVCCLGDLTDKTESDTREDSLNNLKEISSLINSYNIPFYLIRGNHDCLLMNRNDFLEYFENVAPCVYKKDEITFILLDANYRSSMKSFDEEGEVWDDANIPDEQIELLESSLYQSTQAIVMIHENLDPTVDSRHIVKNADDVRQIIKESGKVKMVIQGHFHEGANTDVDGIPYITIPAMCELDNVPYEIIEI